MVRGDANKDLFSVFLAQFIFILEQFRRFKKAVQIEKTAMDALMDQQIEFQILKLFWSEFSSYVMQFC